MCKPLQGTRTWLLSLAGAVTRVTAEKAFCPPVVLAACWRLQGKQLITPFHPPLCSVFPSLSHRAVLVPCSSQQRPGSKVAMGADTSLARPGVTHPPQPLHTQVLDPPNDFIPRDGN